MKKVLFLTLVLLISCEKEPPAGPPFAEAVITVNTYSGEEAIAGTGRYVTLTCDIISIKEDYFYGMPMQYKWTVPAGKFRSDPTLKSVDWLLPDVTDPLRENFKVTCEIIPIQDIDPPVSVTPAIAKKEITIYNAKHCEADGTMQLILSRSDYTDPSIVKEVKVESGTWKSDIRLIYDRGEGDQSIAIYNFVPYGNIKIFFRVKGETEWTSFTRYFNQCERIGYAL